MRTATLGDLRIEADGEELSRFRWGVPPELTDSGDAVSDDDIWEFLAGEFRSLARDWDQNNLVEDGK